MDGKKTSDSGNKLGLKSSCISWQDQLVYVGLRVDSDNVLMVLLVMVVEETIEIRQLIKTGERVKNRLTEFLKQDVT